MSGVNFCPTCGSDLKVVKSQDALSFTEEDEVYYDCVVCGYRYTYVTEPEGEEMKYVTNVIKPSYCHLCDKNFNQSSNLRRHMAAHSGERPFCCKECDKSFKTKAALKRHEIIHTGECPYECSTCKRRFNQINNLRKHLVIHNSNCPFYCEYCGKGFNQLSNLKKHMVVHRNLFNGETEISMVSTDSKKSVTRPVLTFVKPAKA